MNLLGGKEFQEPLQVQVISAAPNPFFKKRMVLLDEHIEIWQLAPLLALVPKLRVDSINWIPQHEDQINIWQSLMDQFSLTRGATCN